MPFARHLSRSLPAVCVVFACLAQTGCSPLPDIAAQSQTMPGPPPVLVPLDGILAQADAVGTGAAAIGPVNARAERLRARADRLRRQ
ncbi:hypothetical protein [Pseudotabrizicola sp.]|nr:hypothetical protein [Pseudotabrizicola sp.]MDO8885209.1 hypothetical protein [Pseudotabrizicola sp.]MDP2082885.1 hypothetical protein [Pseudotabrizicola sp.]